MSDDIPRGFDPEQLRARRAEAARQLSRLLPDDAAVAGLKDELNQIDRLLGVERDEERSAQIELLSDQVGHDVQILPLAEIPEHLPFLERMRERAQRQHDAQEAGSARQARSQSEIDRLDTEIAYCRAVMKDPDLHDEVAARSSVREGAMRRAGSSRTIYLGLGMLVLGMLLFPVALLTGSSGLLAQLAVGLLLVGAILLIAGVVNTLA